MSPTEFHRWLVRSAALLLVLSGGVGVAAVLRGPRDDDCGAYCHSLRTAFTHARLQAQRSLDSAKEAAVKDGTTVTRTVTRYQQLRDTVNIHDTVQVKEFVTRADSVVRSCTNLVESCDRFRVRSDSLVSLLRVENDALSREVASLKPSGFRKAWDAVKVPLAFVAGAYAGSRVVR